MNAPALLAEGLVRRFGKTTALDNLSFRVEKGELYGLVGPDGAGKTTTIRALAGLIALDAGKAELYGQAPTRSDVRERLGLLPQQYSLYRDLSVDENLRFFGRLNALPQAVYKKRVERLLSITRLSPFLDRRADALSGGMYKKLALACSLLHEPDVLLLDEPTNGVDPVSRRELWELLHEFVQGGMAVLIATPAMDEAERCHRTGLIHHGRLLFEGEPQKLLGAFEHETYEVRGAERRHIEAALLALPCVDAISPLGSRLRLGASKGSREELLRVLAPLGASLTSITPSFEDLVLARLREEAA